MKDCSNCEGTGIVPAYDNEPDGVEHDCPECEATGEVEDDE